jgi:hypothetical protein
MFDLLHCPVTSSLWSPDILLTCIGVQGGSNMTWTICV